MVEFQHQPPIPARGGTGAFIQTVAMLDGDISIGMARWHSPTDAQVGLVQLLDLTIMAQYRRQGHGKRLLAQVVQQATELHRRRGTRLRRVWVGIEQKTQIIGRSFLTAGGFHHIAAMNGLYRDQDLMIYVKSLD